MLKNPEKIAKVTEELTAVNAEFSMFTEKCKALAEGRRKKSPIQQELLPAYMDRCDRYAETQRKLGKPLTFAGFALACGLSIETFGRIRKGEYDYITEEYRILHDLPPDATEHETEDGILPLITYRQAFQKCELLIQQQLEENCYTNRGNPAGSIFGLKARYGWTEEQQPQTLNQTLVIADGEQARKALDLLTKG